MQYRSYGKLADKVSVLTLSCARLPRLDDGSPDEARWSAVIGAAVQAGVTCFDIGTFSRDSGLEVLGRALKAMPREQVRVMCGIPAADVRRADDFDRFLGDRLRRLDLGYIDLFVLHVPTRDSWEKMVRFGVLKRMNQAKKAGKVRELGFALHEDPNLLRRVAAGYDGWSFCRIPMSYVGGGKGAFTPESLEPAATKGIAVYAADVIPGGLDGTIPERVTETLPGDREPAQWALSWAWNCGEVVSTVAEAADESQLLQLAAWADGAAPESLSPEEISLLAEAGEIYRKTPLVDCSGCNFCIPCLVGIPIPRVYEAYNRSTLDMRTARRMYSELEMSPDVCLQCGGCLRVCPAKLDGPHLMPKIAELLGGK